MRVKFKILSLFFVLLGSSLVFAGCNRFKDMTPEEKAAYVVEKVSDKLDFTAEQTAKLEDIAKDVIEARKSDAMTKEQKKEFLLEQIKGEELDQEKITSLYNQKKEVFEDVAPKILAKVAELHKTLTPDQKAELIEFVERHADRHHKFH